MNVTPYASSTSCSSTSSATSSADSAQDSNDMFMQLLMAQLKSQSPLDPVDPNQFVGQLVQFNTLDQMIEIRQLVQQVADAVNAGTQSTSQGG
jgi:flagellar basal-body rod modification protein FlgD